MKKSAITFGMIAFLGLTSCRQDRKIPDPAPSTPPVENPKPSPSPKTS